jgi:NAD+ synthase (glutamine-hydrolysing)
MVSLLKVEKCYKNLLRINDMGILRVAMAQINSTVGDFRGNITKIVDGIKRARENDADIVTFPELAICGYPPEDLLLRPGFLRDNLLSIDEVKQQARGIVALVGFVDSVDCQIDQAYNAAMLIDNTKTLGIYHKAELPNYGVFDENRYFLPGSECMVFKIDDVRIAVNICEDIWIEGTPERCAVENGVDVILNLSASPFHAGKLAIRRDKIVSGFAKRTRAYVCYNNLVGGQDELVFDGGSLVTNPHGEVIASAKRFEEDMLMVDIKIDNKSSRLAGQASLPVTSGKDAPPTVKYNFLYNKKKATSNMHGLTLEPRGSKDRKCISAIQNPELGRLEEIYRALVLGTGDYVLKNGFKKVVLGLSGGIDSSLTAAIAVDALGKENVMGVTMPSQYTSNETRSDAEILAENLGIRFIIVSVESIFHSYLNVLEEPFREGQPGLENENLQARIRGNILMALSNRFGWLVLTTGNKSEMAVGYCTLYGDMAGGFAVIKDVPKTMVYELSRYVNEKAGWDIIPRSVIDRPPTAELKPNQTDQDTLPPYELLDRILLAYVEEDRSPSEIISSGFDPETVMEVVRMVDRSEYKRRQAPPGVKITPKAFGRDRRLPITNRYLDTVRKSQVESS